MTTEIKMAKPDSVVMDAISAWLRENVGPGSFRTIKNGFMGMDDWFWYDDTFDDMTEDDYDDYLDNDEDPELESVIFVFRRETDATVFALKWTTQTS